MFPTPGWPVHLTKTLYSNQPSNGDDNQYLTPFTKAQVLNATTDIMGNALLAQPSFNLAQVTTAIPPLRSFAPRIWVANRVSGRDATFNSDASSGT